MVYAMQTAFIQHPLIEQEFRSMNIKPMWQTWAIGGGFQIVTNTPIRKVEDFKGLKQAWVGAAARFIAKLGVEPVPLPYAEWYSSTKTGIVEGFGVGIAITPIMHWDEVAKYVIFNIDLVTGAANGNFVNLDAWNALPDEIKKIAEEADREAGQWGLKDQAELERKAIVYINEKMEVIQFPDEERAKFYEIGMVGVEEEWLADLVPLGLLDEGKEIIEWAQAKKAEIEKTME